MSDKEIAVAWLAWIGIACLSLGSLLLGGWTLWFTATTYGVDIAALGLIGAGVLLALPAAIYIWRNK